MKDMMKNMTVDEMPELDPRERMEITGGHAAAKDNEAAYAAAVELARYMDQLLEKYNYPSAPDLRKFLTPEEKARIRELQRAVFAAM